MKTALTLVALSALSVAAATSALYPRESRAHSQASPGTAPDGPQQTAALTCEIEITVENGVALNEGDSVDWMQSSFPLTVEMTISNIGSNDVSGIKNRYQVYSSDRRNPPVPTVTEVVDLPAGQSISRSFTLQRSMFTGSDDRATADLRVDTDGDYLATGPAPAAQRRCRTSFGFRDVAK